MKKLLVISSFFTIGMNLFAQNVFPTASGSNVGIGTSSPSSRLEIKGKFLNSSGLKFQNLNSTFNVEPPLSPVSLFPYFINNPVDKVLTLNLNGDVILAKGGSIFTQNGYLTSDRNIALNGYSLNFTANNIFKSSGAVEGFDGESLFYINNNGNVGIGINAPDSKLSVNGKIHCKEVLVDLVGWPDYVFGNKYQLPTLAEVEKSILEKGHLPNVPSAKEMETNGLNVSQTIKLQQEKIEELTLYIIAQNKTNEKQSQEIEALKVLVNTLVEKK